LAGGQRPPRNQKIRIGFDSNEDFGSLAMSGVATGLSVALVASPATYTALCTRGTESDAVLSIDAQPHRAAATANKKMLLIVISHPEAGLAWFLASRRLGIFTLGITLSYGFA